MATLDTQGIVFARQDLGLSPVAFVAVGQVVNIGEVGVERALIDTTTLASTLREYKVAIPDGSEIDFDIQYDSGDSPQTGLKVDLDAGTVRLFQITLTDSPATVFAFSGLVISWKIGAPIDNVVPLTVRVKITTSLTIT